MSPTILLFDVDGTLLLTGGAGRRALVRAFTTELDRGDVVAQVDLRGMTDLAVLRVALADAAAPRDPDLLARLIAAYLRCLVEEIALTAQYVVLPGVPEVIAAARACREVAVGLGTGNFERGARIKLARGGLDEAFAFGGFGDDGEARADVLRAGAVRGAKHLGVALASCRIVVIGDTPRDVAAAQAIGAEAVAIATGGFTVAELVATGATSVHPTLAEPSARAAILGASAAAG